MLRLGGNTVKAVVGMLKRCMWDRLCIRRIARDKSILPISVDLIAVVIRVAIRVWILGVASIVDFCAIRDAVIIVVLKAVMIWFAER